MTLTLTFHHRSSFFTTAVSTTTEPRLTTALVVAQFSDFHRTTTMSMTWWVCWSTPDLPIVATITLSQSAPHMMRLTRPFYVTISSTPRYPLTRQDWVSCTTRATCWPTSFDQTLLRLQQPTRTLKAILRKCKQRTLAIYQPILIPLTQSTRRRKKNSGPTLLNVMPS